MINSSYWRLDSKRKEIDKQAELDTANGKAVKDSDLVDPNVANQVDQLHHLTNEIQVLANDGEVQDANGSIKVTEAQLSEVNGLSNDILELPSIQVENTDNRSIKSVQNIKTTSETAATTSGTTQRLFSWWRSEGVNVEARRGANWWFWSESQAGSASGAIEDLQDVAEEHLEKDSIDVHSIGGMKIGSPESEQKSLSSSHSKSSKSQEVIPSGTNTSNGLSTMTSNAVTTNTAEFNALNSVAATSNTAATTVISNILTAQTVTPNTTSIPAVQLSKASTPVDIKKATDLVDSKKATTPVGPKKATTLADSIKATTPVDSKASTPVDTKKATVDFDTESNSDNLLANTVNTVISIPVNIKTLAAATAVSNPEAVEPWLDWTYQYRRVSSVVSSYATKAPVDTKDSLQHPANIISENPEESYTWYSWFFGKRVEDDDDEGADEGTTELYKSAKSAIETSKESSHYAFKSSVKQWQPKHHQQQPYHNQQQLELAVSDTLTETQPVRYRSKKRPLTPNEVQEMYLQMQPLPQSLTLQLPVSRELSQVVHGPRELHRVVPDIDCNFRTITLRTKARIRVTDMWKTPTERHLYKRTPSNILDKKNKVKKVVVIGVHGFLPIKLVKTLIGQSTGNSIAFVNVAARAVQSWLRENNSSFDVANYDIQTIALEGEGKINERVEKLFKLLTNWRSILEESDFIFMVSHSQGVPVAIQLLAELLDLLEFAPQRRIGFLSMAGIINGPYNDLDTKIVTRAYTPREREIIGEIFELQKSNSPTSLQLDQSMRKLIQHNVKISLAGSINDQFVPLTSTLAQKYAHPNIYRFIHTNTTKEIPFFIIKFLGAILTMSNVGWSRDYKLLSDIGLQCGGIVGSEGGHCKIYLDEQVYFTAVKHALETTSLVGKIKLEVRPVNKISSGTVEGAVTGIYDIPWNTRSLLHDMVRIPHIGNLSLIRGLVHEYANWAPIQKSWRELKMLFSGFEQLDMEELI